MAQLRSPTWRRIFRDVYVHANIPDTHILHIRAAILRMPPGAVIAGRSAAHLWGAELADPSDDVDIMSPTRMRTSHGLSIRHTTPSLDETTILRRIPISTAVHTAYEIARELPVRNAIASIDALARAQHLTRDTLVAHIGRHQGESGSRIANDTLTLCDPRAESPPESRLRIELHLAGLPAPIPQWSVYHHGIFIARVDLAWPTLKLAVEYDGQWHADREQLARDRARLRKLNAAGWYIFPVTSTDMRDIGNLIHHLAAVLEQRSAIMEPS